MKNDLSNIFNPETLLLFEQDINEPEKNIDDNSLIEMFPYGVSIGPEMLRPVLILKAQDLDLTMPVLINPMEAGVTLTQNNKSIAPVSPHKVTQVLLQTLGAKVLKCVFIEIKGYHQYVRLFLDTVHGTQSIKVRADEAMSLCLHLEVPIYTTKELAHRSRFLQAEVESAKKDVITIDSRVLVRNHLLMN